MTQASPGRPRSGAAVATVLTRRSPRGRYGVLLLVLIASYVLSAFNRLQWVGDLQIAFFLAVLLLALHASPVSRRLSRVAIAISLAGSAAALGAAATDTAVGLGAADLWRGALLLVTVVLIVRRVLAQPTVTIQSIYGALSAYIIIGLMFAAFYAAISHLGAAPFFADNQPGNPQTFQYFSFTTLTTLGYGDFTAMGNSGRAIAVMEALVGQVFLATLVARLVAAFRVSAEPPGE
ncbi:MAG: potassium channel family protein [Streptosporangiaceae bacterium]